VNQSIKRNRFLEEEECLNSFHLNSFKRSTTL